ncbi:hypothetical protein Tco_0342585 [Tanacetum coccineum]
MKQKSMLSHPEIQGQRKRSLQAPLKIPPTLNLSPLTSLPIQRSQVIQLMTQECNKDQEFKMGHTDDQPDIEAAPKHDWFKKPERPPTPNPD